MQPLFDVFGITMSNVCGYGNHLACTMGTEGCQCPHHEIPLPPDPEVEPEE